MVSFDKLLGAGCSPYRGGSFGLRDSAPFSDFKHFTGVKKPWFSDPPKIVGNVTEISNANELWFYILRNEANRTKFPVDVETLKENARPLSLGLFPTAKMMRAASKTAGVSTPAGDK